jgi:hypothetical protein
MLLDSIFVRPEGRGWCVRRGYRRETDRFVTREGAERHAKQLAHRHRPCELVFQGVDGSVEHRELYPYR